MTISPSLRWSYGRFVNSLAQKAVNFTFVCVFSEYVNPKNKLHFENIV